MPRWRIWKARSVRLLWRVDRWDSQGLISYGFKTWQDAMDYVNEELAHHAEVPD